MSLEELEPSQEALPEVRADEEHEVYAWVRLARFVDVRDEAVHGTEGKGDVLYVDLCSSFPLYAETLRSRHASRNFTLANRTIKELRDTMQHPNRALPSLVTWQEGSYADTTSISFVKNGLRNRFFNRTLTDEGVTVGDQITSIVFEALESAPSTNLKGDARTTSLRDTIFELMHTSRRVVRRIPPEQGETDLEARWLLKLEEAATQKTFADSLIHFPFATQTNLDENREFRSAIDIDFVEPKHAEQVMREMASYLASRIAPDSRPYRAISVDVAEPETLLTKATSGFGPDITMTNMYERARQLRDHVQMDMYEFLCQQPTDSVTFYSCFEGFPIYFGVPEDIGDTEDHLQYMQAIISEVFRSLQPGGIALFFPWNILPDTPQNQAIKSGLLLHLKRIGAEIDIRPYHREEVYHWMTDKERELATTTSPILQSDTELIEMVKITKPRSTAYREWVIKAAAYPQDPMELLDQESSH